MQQSNDNKRVETPSGLGLSGQGLEDFSEDEAFPGTAIHGPGKSCHFIGKVSFLVGLDSCFLRLLWHRQTLVEFPVFQAGQLQYPRLIYPSIGKHLLPFRHDHQRPGQLLSCCAASK